MPTPEQIKWAEGFLQVPIDAPDGGSASSSASGAIKPSGDVTIVSVERVPNPKPVVTLKKPVVVKITQKDKEKLDRVDAAEIAVNERAARLVTTLHQDMHNRVGKWFREEALKTIDKMPNGPSAVTTGLISVFAGGISSVVALSFPEVAIAFKAVEGTTEVIIEDDMKHDAKAARDEAAAALNDIAAKAEQMIYEGRGKALAAIPDMVDALELNPDDLERLARNTNQDVEFLANKRIANRWGELAQPGILDKLEQKLHWILKDHIKAVAKAKELKRLRKKAARRYSGVSEEDIGPLMAQWEASYDVENGMLRPYEGIDTTRPDPPQRK